MNSADSEKFLRAFFHRENNIISWEKIAGGLLEASTQQRLTPWLDDVRNGCFPVILPVPFPAALQKSLKKSCILKLIF